MSSELRQIEDIVDRLSPGERVELLQYLAPRLSLADTEQSTESRVEAVAAWERMKEIGRELAAEPSSGMTASEVLSEMRR